MLRPSPFGCVRFLLLSTSPTARASCKNLTHGAHSPQLRGDKLKLSTLTASHLLAVRGQFGFCARLKRGLPYRAVFIFFIKRAGGNSILVRSFVPSRSFFLVRFAHCGSSTLTSLIHFTYLSYAPCPE